MMDLLKGRRVLVVEDEYLIAADLRRALQACGATVVGPTGVFDHALSLADQEGVDAALVDISLGDEMSYPIVDRLKERRVPCLFLTGYDRSVLPAAYRDTPRVSKPVPAEWVLDRLARLLPAS